MTEPTTSAARMTPGVEPVRITAIAAGGEGVGRLADGRALFVPRTAPGDLIEPLGLDIRARFARARSGRVIEPGPERTTAACRHYDRDACGGCQLQHLTIAGQRAARSAIVGDALRRIGHLPAVDPPIEPSDSEWGYRAKLTLTVKASGRLIGLHRIGEPDRLFDLERCEIVAPALQLLWSAVRASRSLLPPNAERLVLRLARDGSRHLIVECGEGPVWTTAPDMSQALTAAGQPATLWWQPSGGAPRVVSGAPNAYPATVFEQIHPAMGDRVRAHAIAALGELKGQRIWDLYSGIGETSRALAARGARVESVERDPRAVALAGGAGSSTVQRHVGAAEEVVARLGPADLVITNPPRAGMEARVVDAIRAARPRRVAYISCDPATLARDLARLLAPGAAGSLRLVDVRAFDLFPQTAHVETVAVLEGG